MTSLVSIARTIGVLVLLFAWAEHGARSGVDALGKDWVTAVVTKTSKADRSGARKAGAGGSVTIRVRIEADGALADVGIDTGSGSVMLDRRAIAAVRAAAPFRPPPAKLSTLQGSAELSFALRLDGAAP